MRNKLAALCVAGAACWASPSFAVTFDFTGTIQSWTVPTTGFYQIDVWGAQGGTWVGRGGGLGAQVGGKIELSAGTVYSIVVGGMGNSWLDGYGGGGGGASWIFVQDAASPLAVAGGGGGSHYFDFSGSGGPGLVDDPGDGSGGLGSSTTGGGAGWFSAGGDGTAFIVSNGGVFPYGQGGQSTPSFQGGLTFGNILPPYDIGTHRTGGFGGGGGAGYNAGGGGGGYTGGSGNGGGTSYLGAGFANIQEFSGVRSGDGQITIDALGVPEPAAWVLMFSGFGLAGTALRRRRAMAAA